MEPSFHTVAKIGFHCRFRQLTPIRRVQRLCRPRAGGASAAGCAGYSVGPLTQIPAHQRSQPLRTHRISPKTRQRPSCVAAAARARLSFTNPSWVSDARAALSCRCKLTGCPTVRGQSAIRAVPRNNILTVRVYLMAAENQRSIK